MGFIEDGLDKLTFSLKIDPMCFETYLLRAAVLFRLKRFSESKNEFEILSNLIKKTEQQTFIHPYLLLSLYSLIIVLERMGVRINF